MEESKIPLNVSVSGCCHAPIRQPHHWEIKSTAGLPICTGCGQQARVVIHSGEVNNKKKDQPK